MKLLIETGGWIGIGVAVALVLIIIIWAIATYNKFVSLGANGDDAFSTIDVYLKKRYDLIPNLVETVKGYTKHESETFTKVTQARAQAMSATTVSEKIAADRELTTVLQGFRRVTENYPELKANTNFLDLQAQLKNIENELVQARKYYNACVRELNKKIKSFPSLIIAKAMKLSQRDYFTVDAPEERQNVKVQF
ncbi:MAG: LemA family protein [Clostridia bacterium]|nr:LemA family protein [Clostridia bacterium]